MLDVLKVILLGIVEGITEWLPVSSTGHLILVGNVLKPGLSDAFMEMFNVVILILQIHRKSDTLIPRFLNLPDQCNSNLGDKYKL